ncbi:FecR family protein [Pedobacter metabolipauper]|uniref:FecR family protein n=1 Tax=Pedobacter metabolipauper TaxID=425513 RepID=A0A4R6SYN3_9SPHI|nr:FecR domain-containing protein [Pedobacter metabolipauper]TDQ11152.1 FecR family protein [Pedobacter metabolipauper]
MKNTFSKDLFDKYIKGNCTAEEKAIVEAWYLSELKNSTYTPSAERIELLKNEVWNNLDPDAAKESPRSIAPLVKWFSYAASFIVAILFVYLYQVRSPKTVVTQQHIAKANILSASKSENSMMKLSDGSIVILGKGSRLILSDAFNKSDSRDVQLIGKAFFDIKHNEAKPFIIHSGSIKTTVLGTSFDIDADPKKNKVTVNVIRGKVRVEDLDSHQLGVLTRNMQITYDDDANKAILRSIDAVKELSWNKREDLVFNDNSLADAKALLQERFGVKIIVNDEDLNNQKFTGSMGAEEELNHFLESICYLINAKYTINNKTKEVSIKPLNQ